MAFKMPRVRISCVTVLLFLSIWSRAAELASQSISTDYSYDLAASASSVSMGEADELASVEKMLAFVEIRGNCSTEVAPKHVELSKEQSLELANRIVEAAALGGIHLEILSIGLESKNTNPVLNVSSRDQAQSPSNAQLERSLAQEISRTMERYSGHGNQGFVTVGDLSRSREIALQELYISKTVYDEYIASRESVYNKGAYQQGLNSITIGQAAIRASILQKNIQDLEKNISQQQKYLTTLKKAHNDLSIKAGLTYAITNNYEHVTDRPAIVLMQLEREIHEAKLGLVKAEDRIRVCNIQFECNKQHIARLNKEYITQKKMEFDQQSLTQLKQTIQQIGKDSKELPVFIEKLKNEKILHQALVKSCQNKLQSWGWYLNPFGESFSHLENKIAFHHKFIIDCTIKMVEKYHALENLFLLLDYVQERIAQQEAALQPSAVLLMSASDIDSTMSLSQALERTELENKAVHMVSYQLHENTRLTLDRLGIAAANELMNPFSGTYVQQVIHKQLLESLDTMSNVQTGNQQIDQLLQTAVAFNSAGRNLNGQQNFEGALSAKLACNAIIDYAKTITDVILAAGEGVAQGAATVFQLGQAAGNAINCAINHPEEIAMLVLQKLNNAVLAIGKFITSLRLNEDERVYAFLRNDQQLIQELYEHDKATGEKLHAFLEALEKKYQETPFKDQVRALSKNFTEIYLLGKIGGALFEEGAALVDTIKLEATAASADLAKLLRSPQQALAKEIIELAVQTIEQEPAVVRLVLNCIEIDGVFTPRIGGRSAIVGQQIACLLPEKQAVPALSNEIIRETLITADGVNQTCEALLKNGYYEVNGFKFSEYYYKRLWDSGRGAPSLITKMILEEGTLIGPDSKKAGFFKHETPDWELIYNPVTKEVWHLQPIEKKG
ncbi:MAG: hypothetical protein K2X90_03925 [Candidatus Babeliaceae bacterium]|nr:hypothetical protein [Candidatus Babeliaceae bacterium]